MKNKMTKLVLVLITAALLMTGCNIQASEKSAKEMQKEAALYYVYEKNGEGNVSEYFEDFIKNIPKDNEIEVVISLDFEEIAFEGSTDLQMSQEEADRILLEHRAKQKAYHEPRNRQFVDENGFVQSDDYKMYIGEYSPYIQFLFVNIDIFQKYYQQVETCRKSDLVSWIWIGLVTKFENESIPQANPAGTYAMADVLADIGATSQTFNGAGVRVGVLEAADVTTAATTIDNQLVGRTITTAPASAPVDNSIDPITGVNTLHARGVVRTLCGTAGIARGVTQVFNYRLTSGDFVTAMDWFVNANRNCPIVNISLGDNSVSGQYTWTDALMDYYARFNYLTIVKSAGNEGSKTNHFITPPGVAYNVITVGNLNRNNNISTSSSFEVDSWLNMRKPTLAAPGVFLATSANANGVMQSGTSIAAPVVSGVIAKLMQEFPGLQFSPQRTIPVLIASATPITNHGTPVISGLPNGWDQHAGAGRINYQRARAVLSKGDYSSFFPNNPQSPSIVYTKTVTLTNVTSTNRLRISGSCFSNHTKTSGANYWPYANIHGIYNVLLKDSSGNLLSSDYDPMNTSFVSYIIGAYQTFTITIQLEYNGQYGSIPNNAPGDYVGIAWDLQ